MAATYKPLVYRAQGGALQVAASGGTIQIASGGTFQIDAGATWSVGGTTITATAAQINAISTQEAFTADTGGVSINDIICVSGHDAGNSRVKMDQAKADSATTSEDLYWTNAAVAAGVLGYALKQGYFTSALSGTAGDKVYLSDSTAGGVTLTEPTGTDIVRIVGSLATSGASGVVHVDLGGESIQVHDHADNAGGGTLSTPALTGTTSTSFEIATTTGVPSMALGVGTTGDFTITLSPTTTIGANRAVVFQDAAGTVCLTSGTPDTSFTVFKGGGTARLVFDTAGATGNFTHTMVVPNILANKSNTLPTGTAQYYALTANADGTVTTTASSGTTAAAFEVYTGTAKPAMAIGAQAAGTGDFTLTIKPATTVSADADVIVPDGAGTFCMIAGVQTLASKTLTSPHFAGGAITLDAAVTVTGTWTALGIVTTADINGGTIDGVTIGASAAPTVTDLGSVAACDINGGSVDGVIIGAAASAAATVTTLAVEHATTPAISLATGKTNTGTITVAGKTSGSLVVTTNDSTAYAVTLTAAAQGTGTTTVTIPNMANVSASFVMTESAQTVNGVKTFGSAPVVVGITCSDADFDIAGKAGATSVGGDININPGAGHTSGNRGGELTATTGAGVAGAVAVAGTASGLISLLTGTAGASGTGTPGISGTVTIASGTGGGTSTSGVGSASGAVTISSGTGGASTSAANGGAAGTVTLSGGTGGQDIGAADVGGAGGAIVISGGVGGAGLAQGSGGAVTINGGDGLADGAITIGATKAASIGIGNASATTTVTGELKTAAGDNVIVNAAAGAGYLQINAGTSGALKFLPAATTTSVVTIQTADCAAVRTYTIPEAGAAANFVMSVGTQAMTSVDTHTGTLNISGATVVYRAILNADISASADIARSKLVEEAKPYAIDLSSLRVYDAVHTNLPGTPLTDDLGYVNNTWATGSSSILTEDHDSAGAQANYAYGEFVLPAEYVSGQTCTMRFRAHAKTTIADTTMTLDVVVYKSDTEAGIGSDICATAAQSINATAWANFDFTVTPTGLVAGDRLVYRVHTAVNDGASGTAVIAEIGDIRFLLDVKG